MFSGEGGPKGIQVTDDKEDLVLPHLTTDNPINTGEARGEAAFNSQVRIRYFVMIVKFNHRLVSKNGACIYVSLPIAIAKII